MWVPYVTSAFTEPHDQFDVAVHPGDSACLLMFWVHRWHTAKVRGTSTRSHERVTSVVQLTHGLHLAAGMGRRVGQWTVLFALRESLGRGFDPLLGGTRTLNFTDIVLSDCLSFESLVNVNATFRTE